MFNLWTRSRFKYRNGLFKFFRTRLITTPDSDLTELAKDFETEIKGIKHEVYQLCWYMRGGVDSWVLLHDTDLEDFEIMNKIVLSNIENAKTTGMPVI